jgi:ubiquinone/menaquinone biosynthesis C-methylase UbiE
MKNFVPKPDWQQYEQTWLENYDASNYSRSLSSKVLCNTHQLIENDQRLRSKYPTVLELGVGTMAHFDFVKHGFDTYLASDHDPKVVEWLEQKTWDKRVKIQKLSGRNLPFEDSSIDRVIATHVFEHISDPVSALEECVRVVKPGGVISLILPCDPGFLWQLGRSLGPRKSALQTGLPYDYYMSIEHVNSIQNLQRILQFHFPDIVETWWPLRIPSANLNLIYSANCYV